MYFKKKKNQQQEVNSGFLEGGKCSDAFTSREQSASLRFLESTTMQGMSEKCYMCYSIIQIIPVYLHHPFTSAAFLSYFRRKAFESE